MGIIEKVTPKIYEYLRFAGKSSVLEVKPISRVNVSGLKYNANVAQSLKYKDSLFRVTEKNEAVKFAPITQHFEKGGSLVFGTLPDNYVAKSREFIKAHTVTYKFGPYKGQTKTFPDSWEETQSILPHYHIDKLWSNGKGSGTNSVQSVVRKSVNDPKTAGRVTLDACCIDGKTSPAGFYYKLGFRFKDQKMNKQLEEWIVNGGKRENSPFLTGMMYLPAENIEHCLNYKVI